MEENTVGRPLATKRRKRLLDSRVINISYDDLHKMYMIDCRLRNISEITRLAEQVHIKEIYTNEELKKLLKNLRILPLQHTEIESFNGPIVVENNVFMLSLAFHLESR